jgi:hypothetical protein
VVGERWEVSNPAINWVKLLPLPLRLKGILFVIADHADLRNAECRLARHTISAEAGADERTVRRAITALVAMGYVEADRAGGRGLVSALRCRLDVLSARPERGTNQSSERGTNSTERGTNQSLKGDKSVAPLIEEPILTQENPVPAFESAPEAGTDLFGNQIQDAPVEPSELVNGKRIAFEEFWRLYPHRSSGGKMVKPHKKAAEKAFARALDVCSAAQILAAVSAFPFELDRPQFIKEPAGWLAAGGYLSDVGAASPPARQSAATRARVEAEARLDALQQEEPIDGG